MPEIVRSLGRYLVFKGCLHLRYALGVSQNNNPSVQGLGFRGHFVLRSDDPKKYSAIARRRIARMEIYSSDLQERLTQTWGMSGCSGSASALLV